MRANALAALPDSIAALERLRVLDLRANRLEALPDALADLPALEKVDLRWNRFIDPPPVTKRLRKRGCVVLA